MPGPLSGLMVCGSCHELPTLATRRISTNTRVRCMRARRGRVEQGTCDHDVDLLDRYARREQDARLYRQALNEDGRFTRSASRFHAHPAIDKERDANRDVQTLADALVLTPEGKPSPWAGWR